MLANPCVGQEVRIHYAARWRRVCPLHGQVGRVLVRGRGKPRNHGVEVAGRVYTIPCGNLQKINQS